MNLNKGLVNVIKGDEPLVFITLLLFYSVLRCQGRGVFAAFSANLHACFNRAGIAYFCLLGYTDYSLIKHSVRKEIEL